MQLYRLGIPVVVPGPLSLGFVVAEPEGYVSCTTISAGWRDKTWHDEYKFCRCDTKRNTAEGDAWVAGHWECSEYTVAADQSECTSWDWTLGRWVTTFAEIQSPSLNGYHSTARHSSRFRSWRCCLRRMRIQMGCDSRSHQVVRSNCRGILCKVATQLDR
jgi:hypothetical protein